jgi:hypothetical protein
MLVIATVKEVVLLLFHTSTKYGTDRFRQIFIDHLRRLLAARPKKYKQLGFGFL